MPVSLCVLRVEIDEELPDMADNASESESSRETKKRDRGARDSRTITVETYASVAGGGSADVALLPMSTRRLTEVAEDSEDTISFFCGNPLIEVTKGVLHLYKENELRTSTSDAGSGATMLCLLAVPAALGARDLLAFAAACQQDIAHVRVLRDGTPSHYMALLTFRTPQAAQEFHSEFDGVPYSTLEPGALCHTAWVSRVEWGRNGTPPPSHTELPTCPVCLERMDESVAGVLSVQCAHAFHTDCLLGWGDASCPVCRCDQTPEPMSATCFECERNRERTDEQGEEAQEEERRENVSGIAEGLLEEVGVGGSRLWICLICGHVGCGRYEQGHAAKHFRESSHTYALQLGSNRVWDYAGDNFVHRLVQNKSDGKLVAAGERPDDDAPCGPTDDKLDSAQLEFIYILTSQLDSQRRFYEEALTRKDLEHSAECEDLRTRASRAETAAAAFKERLASVTRESKNLEKKLNQVNAKLSTLQNELSEERGLASAMASSQAEWQKQAKAKEEKFEREISELKEQLRDVMFFVEARGQLESTQAASSAELQEATVTVQPPPQTTGHKGRRGKR